MKDQIKRIIAQHNAKQSDNTNEKLANSPRLYEYEIDGFIFYTDELNFSGIRLPTGKAKYTKNYYNTSGELAKAIG